MSKKEIIQSRFSNQEERYVIDARGRVISNVFPEYEIIGYALEPKRDRFGRYDKVIPIVEDL